MISNLPVILHAELADRLGSIGKLWYVCRALSDNGKVLFSLEVVSLTLGVQKRTILDWLSKGKKLGLFRTYTRLGKDTVVVYYSSLTKVCKDLGLSQWGASAEVTVGDLRELNILVTEITAQALQDASVFAAKKSAKQNKNSVMRILKTPEKLFSMFYKSVETSTDTETKSDSKLRIQETTSDLCPGVNGFLSISGKKGSVNTILVSEYFINYGGSQLGIAKRLARHPQTIKNRMRKSNMTRVRVAKCSEANSIEWEICKEERDPNTGRFFSKGDRVYKLLTYIYDPIHALKSLKRRRKEFSTTLKEFNNQVNLSYT